MEGVILLADPNSNAWEFAEKIRDYLNQNLNWPIPLEPVDVNTFANGELDVHVKTNLRRREIYYVSDPTKDAQQLWAELLLFNNLAPLASVERIGHILPELPYSKQDKKKRPHEPISVKAFIDSLLIYPHVKRIITMDLHSAQTQAFSCPCPLEALISIPTVIPYLKEKNSLGNLEELVVLSADSGDTKTAKTYARSFRSRYPVVTVDKERKLDGNRDIERETISGDVKGKRVFIPDDIAGSGDTLITAAKTALECGAVELYCYVTHAWFTEGISELKKYFKKIFVSNTNNRKYDSNIEVIDVSPIFAKAIYRDYHGESVSDLFKIE
ncbi:MAG: ribose-phosphate diphosphokinase [Candidatus Pacearchaeota archaeon]|nr:ribose-phosphate diphosphokinase [Candidatus Pacearchaeota archaeon]